MTPKILLSFHNGALQTVTSNGLVHVFVENQDTLDGVRFVRAEAIPDADFQSLLAGRVSNDVNINEDDPRQDR